MVSKRDCKIMGRHKTPLVEKPSVPWPIRIVPNRKKGGE